MKFTPSRLLLEAKKSTKALTNWIGYDIYSKRSHLHPSNMQFLLESLKERGLQPNWILDVGANKGDWSRIAKAVFKETNCFMIEPQLEMRPKLDRFCQRFPGSQWLLAGAGAAPGELTLTVWDDLAGSSFLPGQDDQLTKAGKQRRVPIVTLDSLVEENLLPLPDLVKLDIQGFELEALKGASKLLNHVEVFILEVALFQFLPGQPVFHDVIGFMRDRGYVVYDFPGFIKRPYDGALAQCDVCFVKHNSFLRSEHCWA